MAERDPIDVLRELADVQRDGLAPPAVLNSELIAAARRDRNRAKGRRRRRVTAVTLVAIVAGGGAVTAGWLLGRSEAPEVGPVCRAGSTLQSNIVALDPDADPLSECADLWRTGQLPDPESPLPTNQPVPPLTACIGPNGLVEVFPDERGICDQLGLATAELTPAPGASRIVELQTRVDDEINAVPCESADVVADRVQQIFDDLRLDSWQISQQPSPGDAACAKATVDSATETVGIFFVPTPP